MTSRNLGVEERKKIDICRVSPMLSSVIHNDTFIPMKKKILLKFEQDKYSERLDMFSPEHDIK